MTTGGANPIDAWQRRAHRLALLLTGGSQHAAARIARRVAAVQRNRGGLDAAHFDRLVILETRRTRVPAGSPKTPLPLSDPAQKLFAELSRLSFQAREAWVLTHVDRQDARRAARAMDCSKSAVALHLGRADEELAKAFAAPDLDAAAAALADEVGRLGDAGVIQGEGAPALIGMRRRRAIAALVVLGAIAVSVLALVKSLGP